MNTTEQFIEFAKSKGFNETEAKTILGVYKRERVIKFNKHGGGFEVQHGAFLDADVMRNALTA